MPGADRGWRWWRWGQGVAGAAILAYVIRFLGSNWDTVRAAPLDWRLRPVPVLASLALVLCTYAMLVEAWRRTVAAWGSPVGFGQAARIWVLSSMGKYLPGKVWAVVGLAALGREAGVAPGVAATTAIMLQLLSIATGAVVVAVAGLGDLERVRPGSATALLGLLVVALCGFALVARPRLLIRVLGRWWLGADQALPRPPAAALGLGALFNLAAWLAYGIALYWLAHGVLAVPGFDLRTAIVAFTASYLAGFLFLLAPGGLGVREGVFVLLTQAAIGPAAALALAAVSRIGMTVADLAAAAPFLLLRDRFRAPA